MGGGGDGRHVGGLVVLAAAELGVEEEVGGGRDGGRVGGLAVRAIAALGVEEEVGGGGDGRRVPSPAALASGAGLGVEEGLGLGAATPRGWVVVGEARDTPAGEARLPLADTRCFFAADRAVKVARMLAAASVAAVDGAADELSELRVACARAAGWS